MTVRSLSLRQYNIRRQNRPCAYFLKRGIEKADERTQWNKVGKIKKKKTNRVEFDYLDRAVNDRLFTGAIPVLFDAGAFACCVSTLGRFAPL